MVDRALIAKKLGRYDIVRVLGKGAMGVVYEARDPNLNRKVAIKTVRVDSLSKAEAAEYELRFRTEAHSAARLQHPNIVSVYDSDRDGSTPFLVMEFVLGEDLKHYLDIGERYTLDQSVRMMRDLLAALDYAHQHKIIHRDIKPANLLIEANGRVKLTDFGVARIQDSGEATRTQGGMVGTLKYMSPEQVEGKSVDSTSDLFSAGIVLYQLLTDRRPFDGDSYFAIVNQIANIHPPTPCSINPMLPLAMDALMAKALAKDKNQRFATAQEFATALLAAASQADPTITPTANPYKVIEPHHTGAHERSGSTASRSQSNTLSNTGSTVTQELELVYWKDVKDSEDPEDLEGFLDRFPDGVYGDLAKRRLKRIADTKAAEGQALYESTQVSRPEEATDAQVNDITLAPHNDTAGESTSTTTVVEARPYEATLVAPVMTAPVVATAAAATDAAAAFATTQSTDDTAPPAATSAPAAPKRKIGIWAGVAAAVLAVGVWFGMGSGPTPATLAPALAAASAAASSPLSSASAATLTAAVSGASAATSTVPGTSTVAIPPKLGASAAAKIAAKLQALREAATRPASATVVAPQPSIPDQLVVTKPQIAVPTPSASVPAALRGTETPPSSPAQACEGRIFLGYLTCMSEQCARPVFSRHPICVERRQQEERRRESEQNR